MTDALTHLIHTYLDPKDLLAYLLFLMFVDIVTGIIASAKHGKIASSVAWSGITRKAATAVAVLFVLAIEPLLSVQMGRELGVSWLITMGFVGVEALSIIENLSRSGVKLPTSLTDAFAKLVPQTEKKPRARKRKAAPPPS